MVPCFLSFPPQGTFVLSFFLDSAPACIGFFFCQYAESFPGLPGASPRHIETAPALLIGAECFFFPSTCSVGSLYVVGDSFMDLTLGGRRFWEAHGPYASFLIRAAPSFFRSPFGVRR